MIDYLLVKLASRCNFDCTYCYWFRDATVRTLPALMPERVVAAFLEKLERHITRFDLPDFVCSFHGGEPTLFGVRRFEQLLDRINLVSSRTKCMIRFALTTNAALLNERWIEVLQAYSVSVAVSLDGPPDVHDGRRRTVNGEPTWRQTVHGYLALCRAGIRPTIIAVCDPYADPTRVLMHFVEDLGATFCDVLVPDANHTEKMPSIAAFYTGLFDHWYSNYFGRGVEVRILTDFIRGLLGLPTRTESIGFGSVRTVCLSPTGKLEPHDVLRIAGADRVNTSCDIFVNDICDIEKDPLWDSVRRASIELCGTCRSCRYVKSCGGGHIAQRWAPENGYNNPSVYCSDFKHILDHIAERIKNDVATGVGPCSLGAENAYHALASGRPEMLFLDSGSVDGVGRPQV